MACNTLLRSRACHHEVTDSNTIIVARIRPKGYDDKRILLRFTGPPVPITARMDSTPHERPFARL
eukprot:9064037-Pyramimonas_sp.AAC.1